MAKFDRCEICDYFDLTGSHVNARHIPKLNKEVLNYFQEEGYNKSILRNDPRVIKDRKFLCEGCHTHINYQQDLMIDKVRAKKQENKEIKELEIKAHLKPYKEKAKKTYKEDLDFIDQEMDDATLNEKFDL